VASAEFLAHRTEALAPLLARIADNGDGADGDAEALGAQLCEVLGHVRLLLADFVVIFGVPSDEADGPAYASWAATTLAGICADAELPLHPALRALWDDNNDDGAAAATTQHAQAPPPMSARRSEMQALRARRRQSSVAGSMLAAAGTMPAAAVTFSTGAHALGDARRQPWRSGAASSNVLVARYLPAAVAQYSPPLVRLLDSGWSGDTCDARTLAQHVQPVVAQCARQSLRLWWAGAMQRVQKAVARGVGRRVHGVRDATCAARLVLAWQADARAERRWARGLAWSQVAANPLLSDVPAPALYAALVEPLLRERARRLHCAAVEAALAQVDVFVQRDSDGVDDVCAGRLPWLCADDVLPPGAAAPLSALAQHVRGGLDFLPPAVRRLRDTLGAALAQAWDDARAWWVQLSGTQAGDEALACARHFAQQWRLLCARLADDSADDEDCRRGIRGAWAAVALCAVARRVVASDAAAAHVLDHWAAAGVTEASLTAGLRAAVGRLLHPWQRALARSTAAAWAGRFDALYYRVPGELRADAPATRRDVVRAWRSAAAGGNPAAAGGCVRYAALRRLAVASGEPPAPSAHVRCLGVALRERVQAVAGLSALADGAHEAVAALLARELCCAVARAAAESARRALAEWDAAQLAADARFVLRDLLALPQPRAA
ncbi:hypothetical protein LPJ73_005565, partial [Coemansia sp. RSA 2703]